MHFGKINSQTTKTKLFLRQQSHVFSQF